ncbi:MAG: hypothetical protein M3P11_08165 [Actinomycetota bacterium]|nr:hypothetical protein [Actinomycetota bacterium]
MVSEPEPKMDLSRPSPLRLAGFLAVAIGGLLLGVGSALNWAVVGFVGSHALDVQTRGIDIWEGKVTLAIGVLALLGIVAMRIASKAPMRRAAALAVTLSGLFASGLMVATVIRGKDRFADQSQLGKIASQLSKAGAGSAADILRSLQATFAARVSFSRQLGLWLTLAGAILAAIGGILSLRWVDRQESQRLSAAEVASQDVEAPDDSSDDNDRR